MFLLLSFQTRFSSQLEVSWSYLIDIMHVCTDTDTTMIISIYRATQGSLNLCVHAQKYM